MATRITVFEMKEGIKGKFGYTTKERRCSECGGEVSSRFMNVCPNCGEEFEDELFDYVPEER